MILKGEGDVCMGNVVDFCAFSGKQPTAEPGEILELTAHLLGMSISGDLVGLAVCARGRDGHEDMAVAGVYRTNPALGRNAAMRLSGRLAEIAALHQNQKAGVRSV